MPLLAPTHPRDRPRTGPSRTGALAGVVTRLAARDDLWRPHVRFDATDRYWTRLDGAAAALGVTDTDLWLLTWLRAQGTELHDHGDSAAAFAVVAGVLTEWSHADGVPSSVELRAGGVRTVEPGEAHDVGNVGTAPAVSLHAYSPRLRRMTYYRRSGAVLVPTRTVVTTEPER